jgi:hypothetical protein
MMGYRELYEGVDQSLPICCKLTLTEIDDLLREANAAKILIPTLSFVSGLRPGRGSKALSAAKKVAQHLLKPDIARRCSMGDVATYVRITKISETSGVHSLFHSRERNLHEFWKEMHKSFEQLGIQIRCN